MDTVGQLFSGSYHNYRTHKHTKHIIELANNNFLAEQYNFYPQHQQHPHQHSHPPSRHSSPHPSPTHTPIPHSPHLFIQPPATDIHQHEHREPDPVDQIQDDPPLDEEPLYVNAKQYYRILKRRVARARLEEVHRLSRQRKVCVFSLLYPYSRSKSHLKHPILALFA